MAISFTKTTWVDLSSPYIDASQLNRIETVLDALVNGSSRAVYRDGDTMTGGLTVATSATINSTVGDARLVMQKAGVQSFEKGLFAVDNTVREAVYDDTGAWIDDVISYPRPAGGTITIGGLGATRRDVNLTKDLKLNGTVRITSGGAGSLTTLSTTGLADMASARVQSLTASQMVATDASKNFVSWDAVTARTNLGIVRDWGYASGGVPTWIKIAKMRIASQYGTASFSARATDIGIAGAGDYGALDVVGRIRQNSPMSSPLDYANLIVSRQGATGITFGYVVDVDNSTEKVVSVYVSLTGYCGAIASAIASSGEVSFLSGQPLLTSAPAEYVPATWAASTVGSFRATSLAGTGSRLVQAGADGTNSASIPVPTAFIQTLMDDADMAAARATLGAQAALGYTPVNKAGDTMTGGLTLSAGNLNVGAGAIQTAGVTRISSGGAGVLTTLSTTGLATLQSVNISGLTGSRMLSLDASKNVVSLFPVTSIVRTIFRKHSSESLLINAATRSVFNFGSNNTGSLNVSSAEMKTPGLKVVGKSVFTSSQAAGTVVNYQSSIAGSFGPSHTWTKAYASSVVEITSECLMMPGNDVSIITTLIETDDATGASKRFSGFQSDVVTISKTGTEQFQTTVYSGVSFSVSVISAEQIMQ